MIQQRGYTPQDIEACLQLRRSLEEAGVNGLDIRDLYKEHTDLEEAQCGRSRSLQQYLMVNPRPIICYFNATHVFFCH